MCGNAKLTDAGLNSMHTCTIEQPRNPNLLVDGELYAILFVLHLAT